ncbi:MAG: hypothetical protein ACKVOF_05840 [Pseudohongiellaceae bacterium]
MERLRFNCADKRNFLIRAGLAIAPATANLIYAVVATSPSTGPSTGLLQGARLVAAPAVGV